MWGGGLEASFWVQGRRLILKYNYSVTGAESKEVNYTDVSHTSVPIA